LGEITANSVTVCYAEGRGCRVHRNVDGLYQTTRYHIP